jgi:chromosome segregation ATPase
MFVLAFLLLGQSSVQALSLGEKLNPIRKIVTLLQDMQKEIETDGKKEEEAYDKFMCYCDGNSGSMSSAAEESTQMVATLGSKLEALKAEKAQLDQELKGHQDSRAAAKVDLKKAANLRAKESEEYVATSTDMENNIAAMKKAIAALEKGMGSFLQMPSNMVSLVETAVERSSAVDDFQKQDIMALLQGKQEYSPQSGQITGMLKAMLDEMSGDLKTTNSDEATAAQGFADLKAAKTSEVNAATSAIEQKTRRSGELAVEIAQTEDDLEDTQAEVAETEKFLGDLGAQCAAKKAEWSERQTMRAEEVAAISEAIGILNDDDSLDLFKKTAHVQKNDGIRLLQGKSHKSNVRRARHILVSLAQTGRSHESQFQFLATALKAKAVDFTKISGMIDGMVDVLGKEQSDDDAQKKFCDTEFEKAADEKKSTEEKLAALAASIEEMTSTVATITSEIETLQAEIKKLDGAVAEATATRKEEHATFVQMAAENQAATALVEKAKNRLFKVYRPGLYKEEARRELTEEERILVNSGQPDPRDAEEEFMNNGGRGGIQNTGIVSPISFAQVRVATNDGVVPPPPPETFGAYQKKEGKSNGVIALMDMMIKDLKTDHTEAKHAEETAQKDYETLMATSQESREKMAACITSKESSSAEWTEKIENAKTDQASTTEALGKLNELIAGLHAECDFLIANYDTRKEARTNEIEGLKNAKAVLSGASFE